MDLSSATRRAGAAILACLCACICHSACGQPAGAAAGILADYMLSGQTPHPAVVRIVAAEESAASLGSGVLVDVNHGQGLVLTNWHVVRDSRTAVLVQFPDGFQTTGTVVRTDEPWDLAAIVIWKPPATPVPLSAVPPTPGEILTIAGYGRGPYRAQSGRCTEYLSPGTGYPREFVELSVGARQGDSGGPIFNERGELAGVLFGQNDGRTVGSCSTRLRTFLASVGSSGYDARAAAALAASPGAATPFRMAAATLESGGPARPQDFGSGLEAGQGMAPVQAPAWGTAGSGPWPDDPSLSGRSPLDAFPPGSASGLRLPTFEEVQAACDFRTNGPAILSAAGGTALLVLGLKVLFGGRRRTAVQRRSAPQLDDDFDLE